VGQEEGAEGASAAEEPVAAAPAAHAGNVDTCDAVKCDGATGAQYYDASCVANGGLGCVDTTGCRFCRMEGDDLDKKMQYCPPCTCDALKTSGCKPSGTLPELDGEGHRNPASGAEDEDVAAETFSTEAAAAAAEAVPAEAVAQPLNGASWRLSALGKFESCDTRWHGLTIVNFISLTKFLSLSLKQPPKCLCQALKWMIVSPYWLRARTDEVLERPLAKIFLGFRRRGRSHAAGGRADIYLQPGDGGGRHPGGAVQV
jgi:hypothetical protein